MSTPNFAKFSQALQKLERWKAKMHTDAVMTTEARSVLFGKKKSNPITGLDRPRGFQEVEVPRFQDSRHMKVARLSALRTGRFLPPGNIPGTHFC